MLKALTTCACGSSLRDLLRPGAPDRGYEPGEGRIEGVGDIDDDLAGQRVPILGDDRRFAGVRQGEDDDVPGRDAAERSRRVPPPSPLARAAALAASRPMTSTMLPQASARACPMLAHYTGRVGFPAVAHELIAGVQSGILP